MVEAIEFATHTVLAQGLQKLIVDLHERTKLRVPIKMYIAGGMAFHLYTASRVTTDVDAGAEHALQGYVGNEDYLRMNLRDVLKLAHGPTPTIVKK
jgi:hypothetical protein